ncbi:hypothetical protein FEF26_01725 [Nesterenkonia salmonea]|uniref:Fis family transcriptional regulator n=1 Tax=Nesterenkonia salmonea TaxID=1804987 RepID=A0A5R9BIA2_9MICC|nr:hypothetical protein [Nesterenkonia salmonea]TLQ00309.1 hypothetical protein FEF26_01725 [Nesterenkonia salmonea]
MRWDALFADLQAQASAQRQEVFESSVAEAVALEWSRVELVDRIRGHTSQPIAIRLRGGETVTLDVRTVGSDWIAGGAAGYQWLIPVGAVDMVKGLTRRTQVEPSQARRRLSITSPLRALAEARHHIVVRCETGVLAEGALLGVGRDFLDVRTESDYPTIRTVPLAAITAVCSGRS